MPTVTIRLDEETDARLKRRLARSSLRSFAFIEGRWRHPYVPFWTVAPDLSNRWG